MYGVSFILFMLLVVTTRFSYSQTQPTHFIFSHGLGGGAEQVYWYKPGNPAHWFILDNHTHTFDFPEMRYQVVNGKRLPLPMDEAKVNLAQEADIHALKQAYQQVLKSSTSSGIVLMGVSRGAAVTITFTALEQPKHIQALILEAPFDSLEHIVEYLKAQYAHNNTSMQEAIELQWHFAAYNKHGIKPIDVIDKLDKNLPVLFIHSKQDKLISLESCRNLYTKLKKSGRTQVYLLELDHGEHANYQSGKDAFKYQATVHAFYKRYGITHNEQLALQGHIFLDAAQP
ncbi:prolyl oligopeptidase family serine peptidase [Candidatus Dependentiae bacterium]|nr:prolyl oligopeptidase family serine peptidase [Candidatus Dependentiae bacterium]